MYLLWWALIDSNRVLTFSLWLLKLTFVECQKVNTTAAEKRLQVHIRKCIHSWWNYLFPAPNQIHRWRSVVDITSSAVYLYCEPEKLLAIWIWVAIFDVTHSQPIVGGHTLVRILFWCSIEPNSEQTEQSRLNQWISGFAFL